MALEAYDPAKAKEPTPICIVCGKPMKWHDMEIAPSLAYCNTPTCNRYGLLSVEMEWVYPEKKNG